MTSTTRPSGPDVVLLHGWGGSPKEEWTDTGWVEQISRLGRRAHVLPLPGHGSRLASHDPSDYADLAGEMLADLPASASRIDFIGFSLGAKIGLEVARRSPERVRRLVMLGAGDNVFGREQVDLLVEAVSRPDTPGLPPFVRDLAGGISSGNDPAALTAVLQRPPNPVFTESALSGIAADVLLVSGARDEAFVAHTRLTAAIPSSRAHIVPGVDHVHTTASPEVRGIVMDFLTAPHLLTT